MRLISSNSKFLSVIDIFQMLITNVKYPCMRYFSFSLLGKLIISMKAFHSKSSQMANMSKGERINQQYRKNGLG